MLAQCAAFIGERISHARQAIRQAQASANEETKSSAGDKYETGRAMAQLEIEKNRVQLAEAERQMKILRAIDPDKAFQTAREGSVVFTDRGNFFIAVAAGQLTLNGERYMAVSSVSPIAGIFLNRAPGESVTFNTTAYLIEKIL